MIERDWHGCYKEGWKGVIVDDAFAHPAKFSRALIRRIYEHAFEQGWLEAGDTVVDPFGGVALGGLQAMRRGLHWVGVELEPRFVGLGNQNIDLWNATYADALPGWGTARLVQGDSRELARIVGEAGAVVSSPPYAHISTAKNSTGVDLTKQYETYKAQGGGASFEAFCETQRKHSGDYGSAQGQLANLPEGDFCAAISSPPYAEGCAHTGGATANTTGQGGPIEFVDYGTAPGQLGAMPAGEFAAACVSSPPFENGTPTTGDPNYAWKFHGDQSKYGDTSGNIGCDSGPTFWTAARAIVAQTYHVLRPGAVAIWVTKSFVRNKARVDFPGQWLQLCQSCGFEPLEWVRAWLVEDNGTQRGLFGNDKRLVKERKSFFRRLAEKKGSPPIDYEVVVIVKKPAAPNA